MRSLTLRSCVTSTTLAFITVAALDRTREISKQKRKKGVRNYLMLKAAKQIGLTIRRMSWSEPIK